MVTSLWLFVTIVTFILQTDSAIQLSATIPGDFTNFFSFTISWLLVTAIFFASTIVHYVWHQTNRQQTVLAVFIVSVALIAYGFLLYPEIDLFFRLRQQ